MTWCTMSSPRLTWRTHMSEMHRAQPGRRPVNGQDSNAPVVSHLHLRTAEQPGGVSQWQGQHMLPLALPLPSTNAHQRLSKRRGERFGASLDTASPWQCGGGGGKETSRARTCFPGPVQVARLPSPKLLTRASRVLTTRARAHQQGTAP